MNKINELIKNGIVILDGAMGTELQKLGMESGICPELLNVENPEMIKTVNRGYVDAGSNIIETNTFGGNRLKLAEFGLEDRVEELNIAGVKIAKECAGDKALVFASVSSTGKFIEPVGDFTFDEIYDVYKEQALAIAKSGADGVIIETMTDIKEMKVAVIAFKDNTNLPIFASMTFQDNGRTVTGTDPYTAAVILDSLGVDAIGLNCSVGPAKLLEFAKITLSATDKPVFVQPNAGLPRLEGDKTIFDATPTDMLEFAKKFNELGINILGGCCGNSPAHIKALADFFRNKEKVNRKEINNTTKITSRTETVEIGSSEMVKILGERINPNALKRIKQDVLEYRTTNIRKEALAQVKSGADLLDVNVGVGTIDEAKMMKKAILAVENLVQVPLSIDTTDEKALEEGLKAYSGKPLINSVTYKKSSMETVFPLAKKYGAAVLGLTIDKDGIPRLAEKRLEIAEKLVAEGIKYGLKKEDILIDTLVLTASAEQEKVLETVNAIRLIKEKIGVSTVLGLSNISFGLPNRKIINSSFLAMCISAGLDMPIMNPSSEILKDTIMSACVLTNRDKNCSKYIEYASDTKSEVKKDKSEQSSEEIVYNCVIDGDAENIVKHVDSLISQGMKSLDIINKILIPAITEVGELYDKGKYFLPQLMMSAQAMKTGVNRAKESLNGEVEQKIGKILFSTVKNDVHDIGKNIVVVLLENNGFEVIDLGKDIDTDTIIDAIKRENPDIVGLSALMTTTMVEMRKTIKKIQKQKLDVKIMVGGAVVTPEFADELGVHFSKDAVEAVKVAKQMLGK